MKVVLFEPDYNEKHRLVLRALAKGIPGSVVRPLREYEPCDVAVIFGVVKNAYPPTWPKRQILDRHHGRGLIVVESAFVKRGEYWQVGFGGFAGYADFRNEGMPMDRWESFGVKSHPWRRKPDGPVVVCGQLPRDTQVQGVDHKAWCRDTVAFYDGLGLPVIFRPHPRIDDVSTYGVDGKYIDTRDLGAVIEEARFFVTWNSTTGVDAGIMGVPVIACERGSMAWPIANHSIEEFEEFRFQSRRAWLAGIGYAQWSLAEMKAGLPWKHLTRS